MKSFTVSTKMTIGFCIAFLIIIIVTLVAINDMYLLRNATKGIVEKDWPKIKAITEISSLTKENGLHAFAILVNKNADNSFRNLTLNKDKITKNLEFLESAIYREEGKKLLTQIKTRRNDYVLAFEKIPVALNVGAQDGAAKIMIDEVLPKQQLLNTAIAELIELQGEILQEDGVEAKHIFSTALTRFIWLLLIGAALMIVSAYVIIKGVVRPLGGEPQDVANIANTIANGNLTTAITLKSNDDSSLLASMIKMQRSLRETILHISTSASQLAGASEELNAVTEDSNRSVHEQNNQLEQAASAINEMTFAVNEVARNASSTALASNAAGDTAKHGYTAVTNTIESISSLALEITSSANGITILAEQVKDISKVLDVIRSVSEQTNLLALNAAIEAARAGDAGRGFAVVADEVRSLAHRTQKSTHEIEEMISAIRSGSENAVNAMVNSKERAQDTLLLATTAGQAIDKILHAITQISDSNILIATATEEQAQATREVDKNIVTIRDISIQSAASANQTNASSLELANLANQLNELIARFKV